jgi:hypothetical protein
MFPNLGSMCRMVTWLTRFCACYLFTFWACYPYSCLSSDRGTHRFPCFQTWDRCVPRWYGRQELCHTLLLILMFPTVHQLPLCSKSMSYDWKTYNLRQIFSVLSFFGLWWLELIYYSCLSSNRVTHPCPCFQTWDGCVSRFNDCHESSVSLLLQVQVVWGHFCMFLLHCQADDEPVHHLSIMTSIKPCETSMPMFLKLGLDLSHGSMAAMKHLLLIYLPEATIFDLSFSLWW